MRRLALVFSSGLGLGYLPWAPGTFGTLWGVLLFYLGRFWPWPYFAAATLLFIFFAVAVSRLAEQSLGEHDSSQIVIDEVAGYLTSVVALPFGWKTALLAFVLFRIFDIVKPYPIRYIDRHWGGGWGVVMDDVVAGIFANIVLRLLMALGRMM
ncbi:MAG TPA: phosphatidylglycerophosphatase A [Deltaproteobacteria bacterium]|nr:phosphatidylglycerophosphatase A [Deltaproteobacteria bacterium]